jgi:hypothetical protein
MYRCTVCFLPHTLYSAHACTHVFLICTLKQNTNVMCVVCVCVWAGEFFMTHTARCSCAHAYNTEKQKDMQVIRFHLLADAMHAFTHTHTCINTHTCIITHKSITMHTWSRWQSKFHMGGRVLANTQTYTHTHTHTVLDGGRDRKQTRTWWASLGRNWYTHKHTYTNIHEHALRVWKRKKQMPLRTVVSVTLQISSTDTVWQSWLSCSHSAVYVSKKTFGSCRHSWLCYVHIWGIEGPSIWFFVQHPPCCMDRIVRTLVRAIFILTVQNNIWC